MIVFEDKISYKLTKLQMTMFHSFLLFFGKVWRRGAWKPGNWHFSLAVTLGDCDWLLFLNVWGGASESDWSATSPAGHRQRQHRSSSTG